MTSRLRELLAIMERLRGDDGCPWDRVQTFATIAPYTIEESYEVADAVERGDMAHLKDELGDLLFQVVFHARMAQEAGLFDFDGVAGAICDKLVRRHPHVFGGVAGQNADWEDIKARERAAASSRVGFDFERAEETADKVAEELAEVREAAAHREAGAHRQSAVDAQSAASQHVFEEVGDLLFAAANLARKLDVDAEAALRAANGKFERRFQGMERLAAQRGENFETLSLAAQEALWQEVKRAE